MNRFLCTLFLLLFSLISLEASEKIYAIMITGKDDFHFNLALCSIESFLQQTYPNKKLIIINDGNYNFDHIQDERIQEIHLDEKRVLGELRNIGLDAIPENAVWTVWDDDDWHHPKLMEKQYKQLVMKKANVCSLNNQVQYSFLRNNAWVKCGDIFGNIMCRNKSDIRYPHVKKSEDVYFLEEYRNKYGGIIWDNPPHYYLRFIHGYNTWEQEDFEIQKKKSNKWKLQTESSDYLARILERYEFAYPSAIESLPPHQ